MAVLSNTWNDRLIDSIFVLPLLNFSMMDQKKMYSTWSHVTFHVDVSSGFVVKGRGKGFRHHPQQWRVTSTTCFSKFGLVGLPAPEPNEKKKRQLHVWKVSKCFDPLQKLTFFIIAPRNWCWNGKTNFFRLFLFGEAIKVVPMFKGQNSLTAARFGVFGWCFFPLWSFDELVTSDP